MRAAVLTAVLISVLLACHDAPTSSTFALVTVAGINVGALISGVFIVEYIFQLPGLGLLTIRSFFQFDLPVLMGTVLVGAVVLVSMNLIVDLLYTVLDPRVRLG